MGMVSVCPRRKPLAPRHAKLADVVLVDLLQRAEALRVVGAAVHQPVVRAGILQYLLCHRLEILHLCEQRRDQANQTKGKLPMHHHDVYSLFKAARRWAWRIFPPRFPIAI